QGVLQLTVWRSNGSSFEAGSSTPLGAPQAEQQFHAADVNGDGRSDLVRIWRNSEDNAVASTWTADGPAYRFATSSSLGPWIAGGHYRVVGEGSGECELVRNSLDSTGAPTVDRWYYRNGFDLAGSERLAGPPAPAPLMRHAQILQQAGEAPVVRHFQQTLPAPGGSATNGGSTLLADLAVSDLQITPHGDWSPGDLVTVSWSTANQGLIDTVGGWSERLEVRNSSTGELVLRQEIDNDPAAGGTPLAVGESRPRSLSLAWPGGNASAGRIKFRVVVDCYDTIAEPGSTGTADDNNEAIRWVDNGPDLQVRNLRVLSGSLAAGALIDITWEDFNAGAIASQAGWDDHLQIRKLDSGEILCDLLLPYDPLQAGQGSIAAGTSRQRSQSFRLPDGIRGSGWIEISVSADENQAGRGALFETSHTGDAESNNRAALHVTSLTTPYPDLRVNRLQAPGNGIGSMPISVAWTVSNQGGIDSDASWDDELVYSNDTLIGNEDDLPLATVRHHGGLRVGESYSQRVSVALPVRGAGRYYLGIRSDRAGELLEPDTRADNQSDALAIDLVAPYADLVPVNLSTPTAALSGERITLDWLVINRGNANTDQPQWNDRLLLSRDAQASQDDLVLADALLHSGGLAPGETCADQATIVLPHDLSGDYYLILHTNPDGTVDEATASDEQRAANNLLVSSGTLHISLSPTPDLTVVDLRAPDLLRPGDTASLSYTVSNQGSAASSAAWWDRIYLDRGTQFEPLEVAAVLNSQPLAPGKSVTHMLTVELPGNIEEGDFRWLVHTDADDALHERLGEDNNRTSTTLHVARPDLAITALQGPALARSGDRIRVQWQVHNRGATASGDWIDAVYLVQGTARRPLGELVRQGGLAAGAGYDAAAEFELPLDCRGDYRLLVVTDATGQVDDHDPQDNRDELPLSVEQSPWADLAVTEVSAPQRVIGDPARFSVRWTVSNQGTGAGRSTAWSEHVILSTDELLGNEDDRVVAEYRQPTTLAPGEAASREVEVTLPPATSARYRLFVVADPSGEVFENSSRTNNIDHLPHVLDILPTTYADLQVISLTTQGAPASGQPLRVEWEVINRGIDTTDTGDWWDEVWLSRNPDGSDIIASFEPASHIGQLAPGESYRRSLELRLPDGVAGDHYFNVRTGGPFEFIFADNNTASSPVVPITLSSSPDLIVASISFPAAAREDELIDVSWTVLNQGQAAASGIWQDALWLVPASGGEAIELGRFSYDRNLAAGVSYTRSEQLRLPVRSEGLYRLQVVSNAGAGPDGTQPYEHGVARDNNARLSADLIAVGLKQRPDLRLTALSIPQRASAGGTLAARYSVSNFGTAASSGHWTDKVYLSPDASLSADDQLVGDFASLGALAPGESYANESALIDIPLRQRGDAFLIVVADGNSEVDEFPNETNNVHVAPFRVDPLPFADLVTSDVVAPDQGVHGASIGVRYRVANLGSARTRGETASVDGWTDSLWLTRDARRPGAWKGDILLGSFNHAGKLEAGEDYRGDVQVALPDDLVSGQYYLTVWSDTYDLILEDTLATQINPDDPQQIDNNNYRARPISILGSTPPDLVLGEIIGPTNADAGGNYSYSYSVFNRGDRFTGDWIDSVYLSDHPDLAAAQEVWHLADHAHRLSLGDGERYTVNQTLALAPSTTGRFLVVHTDADNQVDESNERNNSRSTTSLLGGQAADLRVSELRSETDRFSGEETNVNWTVSNSGAAVWSGTRFWVDAVYLSRDSNFIPDRAQRLASVTHANVSGLASGGSYTASVRVRLPAGGDGLYYLHVVTDADPEGSGPSLGPARQELTSGGDNNIARDHHYASSVYEAAGNDNNLRSVALPVIYREADLQIDEIALSTSSVNSGDPLTASWKVSNHGSRETRTDAWFDGLYLSRDASLDAGDYPLLDGGSGLAAKGISLSDNGRPKYLQPGESYTASASFNLPDSISGDFHLILRTDTTISSNPWENSTIRAGLPGLASFGNASGMVEEFRDEGNNEASTLLSVTPRTSPDLQVSEVGAPASAIAGQSLAVHWRVVNAGGDTPADQTTWNDLVYLSRDRFLDLTQDHYLGYVEHSGGLASGDSYESRLQMDTPPDLSGPYYVFVVSDPVRAWGSGESGKLREFGNEQNNAGAAPQPLHIAMPPAADLKLLQATVPASGRVGEEIHIDFAVVNDSINTAHGHWTDALYLSADTTWDLGDLLIGKVGHSGDLAGGSAYQATLSTHLPPVKEGQWHVIVRPDLYNDVFEGSIGLLTSGLELPSGEANNRTAAGATLQVQIPELPIRSPLATTLSPGEERVYRLSVAAGETLRVSLDALVAEGSNELYLRYGDIPTGYSFDAAYGNPVAADQQALVSDTRAGNYYLLLRARQGAAQSPVSLRADLLPLSISHISPDHGGTGNDRQPWVTVDIHGAHFQAGALVRLSRPGVFEAEPERWQVLDATHIRAVFDTRRLPLGLYDLTITNPDGQQVTEAQRFLVERGIESEVTIGIGGPRRLDPGDSATYSVSLQSLGNLDTPYVHFVAGVPEMGYSADLLAGLPLPYLVLGSAPGSQPDGRLLDPAGNTQRYGPTPSQGLNRSDIPWARLDALHNSNGSNLAPAYAWDVAGGGFVGSAFTLQTYPGLAEWLNWDFAGLREKLYTLRPTWRTQGLLDGGVADLDRIAAGLSRKFLSRVANEHLGGLETLAMPFRFDVVAAATPLTRDEFIAEQKSYASKLRAAIIGDPAAAPSLAALAADTGQWQSAWLAALEAAGLLQPSDEAPPIREQPKVLSLNATLASGIVLGKGGEIYRTQADLLGFFAKVQEWYGDTARYSGDPDARQAPVDYVEVRQSLDGTVDVPVSHSAERGQFELAASHETHFVDFDVFVGGRSELEYLRHIGVLDGEFRPVTGQSLNLARYLQADARQSAGSSAALSVRPPQALRGTDGRAYVPRGTALPYSLVFTNPGENPAGELRIVSQLDPVLDPRSFRLGDLRIGNIDVHLPGERASFQGDFDFTASQGFILRVSAGVDTASRMATWLLQAIDPDSGEVLRDRSRGLLATAADASRSAAGSAPQGFVSYTVRASDEAPSGSEIGAASRLFIDATPPIDGSAASVRLDAGAPQTTLTVNTLGQTGPDLAPTFELQWSARDDLAGIASVTLHVAENGGDLHIWQRRLGPQTTRALFTGEAGKRYEFLAVATDRAGNTEATTLSNAALPEDGARQEALAGLGINETLSQTTATPLAAHDRSYPTNPLFAEAIRQLPGTVASSSGSDLRSVLAPFALRGFAHGYAASAADIGAQALVEMPDHHILASAGTLRNQVYSYHPDGLQSTDDPGMPLFALDTPVIDLAVDALGQLWVMTGNELLQVDPASGGILRRLQPPGGEPLTHALAVDPRNGEIYASTRTGIVVFDPAATDTASAWRRFSKQAVGDLAFAPDGRLWAVRWTGGAIPGVAADANTEIVSFPLSGPGVGRAEIEYRVSGILDSIAFGVPDTPLAGLLLASSQPGQHPVPGTGAEAADEGGVWMIELASRERLQLASGGTRGEAIVATHDGRILVAGTRHIDEIALRHAPLVKAVTVPDGALVPLPLQQIGVVFDQEMWTGEGGDDGSVLNPANYTLHVLNAVTESQAARHPAAIRWDAASHTAWLAWDGLVADDYRLEIAGCLRSAAEIPVKSGFETHFTTLNDLSQHLRLDFSRTRANRATGTISYDVNLTNIGNEELSGPLVLLLDPGRYFDQAIAGATPGSGDQSDLWLLDLGEALQKLGGKLAVGATIAEQTVSIVPASRFAVRAGMADLLKANLGHGIYAAPQTNQAPSLSVAGEIDADHLPTAVAGEAWSVQIEAVDPDGSRIYWQLVEAPDGISLTAQEEVQSRDDGSHALAILAWTPATTADASSEIVVRVADSRGGFALRRWPLAVDGGNHVPVIATVGNLSLREGETLSLALRAADADGDRLTLAVSGLPPGATFDAASGRLSWTPGYDQAGNWPALTVHASDGRSIASQSFAITVEAAHADPRLAALPLQALREGEACTLQLDGRVPGVMPGIRQTDGSVL
ncbi:MAG: hypothetical protein JNK99_13155, partial [Candidatus Accumulibacter sp.]|uniref:CARDB domain-containing protein n=1 Tax=Accumulibacter sp. TaxID=2053492 RepID=UPI001A3FC1BD